MLRRFAQSVTGRQRSAVLALLISQLPLMNWLAVIVLALNTLERDYKYAVRLVLWYGVICFFVSELVNSSWSYLIFVVLYGGVLTLLMAALLRETGSWSLVFTGSTLLGVSAVMVVHMLYPDIQQFWYNEAMMSLAKFEALYQHALPIDRVQEQMELWSTVYTGVQAAMYLTVMLASLMTARWMQARLYDSTGFSRELLQIHLNWLDVSLLLAVAVISQLMWSGSYDLLPVVLLPCLPAGLAAVHRLVHEHKRKRLLLTALYLVLLLFLVPTLLMLTLVSVADFILYSRGNRDGSYSVRNRT